jgi:hypothetical protein
MNPDKPAPAHSQPPAENHEGYESEVEQYDKVAEQQIEHAITLSVKVER